MKKKIFSLAICCFAALSSASAQDGGAFKHLSIGLELFSTTGFGIELTTPLNSRFALRGGLSMLPLKFSADFDTLMDDSLRQAIDIAINRNSALSAELANFGIGQAADVSGEVDVTATLGLVNGKILLDFSPASNGVFHLTGGVYIGQSKLIKVEGGMELAAQVFNIMESYGVNFFDYTFAEKYDLRVRDLADMNAALTINSIKPYFGIGFGRAVPKRRIGARFEIGAFFQGTPKITSEKNSIQTLINDELGGTTDTLKKFSIYPVVSLKLNVKAF